jgi:hypothetical protein
MCEVAPGDIFFLLPDMRVAALVLNRIRDNLALIDHSAARRALGSAHW